MVSTSPDLKPSPLYNPTLYLTGHDDSGKAIIFRSSKGKADPYPEKDFWATTVYTTAGIPVDLNGNIDVAAFDKVIDGGKLGVVKPNGTVVRFADFAPGSVGFMHRTQSIDFGIVLEGEVDLGLDDGSTTRMTRGDVAVQRSTQHQWNNASKTEWARVLFVLQDAKPLTVNGQVYKEDLGSAHGIVPSSGND